MSVRERQGRGRGGEEGGRGRDGNYQKVTESIMTPPAENFDKCPGELGRTLNQFEVQEKSQENLGNNLQRRMNLHNTTGLFRMPH